MKRIIFHIGTHKTATTAIQTTLFANRDKLHGAGVLYPSTARHHPDLKKHTSLFLAAGGNEEEYTEEKRIILSEFEKSQCHTMVLSAEAFSAPHEVRLERFARFSEGYNVEVICFLRRQDWFMEALWSQKVKEGKVAGPIERWLERKFNWARMSYDAILLDSWGSFASVRAVNFEEARKFGVMPTFCKLAGTPPLREPERLNVSPSSNCTLIFQKMNQMKIRRSLAETRQIEMAFRDDPEKLILGRRLRSSILDAVAKGNARIEEALGVSFDANLPEETYEPKTEPDPEAVARAMVRLATTKT